MPDSPRVKGSRMIEVPHLPIFLCGLPIGIQGTCTHTPCLLVIFLPEPDNFPAWQTLHLPQCLIAHKTCAADTAHDRHSGDQARKLGIEVAASIVCRKGSSVCVRRSIEKRVSNRGKRFLGPQGQRLLTSHVGMDWPPVLDGLRRGADAGPRSLVQMASDKPNLCSRQSERS
jgi:hypothetical protein